MNLFKKVYKQIKKYNTIVLARHIGADPDALGSTFGLKEIILNTFPNKKVYVVGQPALKFKYIGITDKFETENYDDVLLIILDTPDKKRVDGVDVDLFKHKIKIDHHPFVETFCDIELIDDTSSSASQLVMELIYNTRLKPNVKAAEKLYIGLIGDTERFLYNYTTPKTFDLVSKLIKETKLDFTKLYEKMYLRSYKELNFQGYIWQNLTITENGFAYIKLSEEILEQYNVDASTAGNMVNNFNYAAEYISWGVFSYDKANNNIKGSIRSRGPIINEVAKQFGGGGHIYASGVRLESFDVVDDLVKELDKKCLEYKESNNVQ